MKWQNRVVYHSINPGGPNGFDTQAVEWLQIEPLGCSSPRAAALSQQYILCWFFACQLIASLFLLSILEQYMGFSLVVGLSPSFLHKPCKQEKKAAAGNYTVGSSRPEWHVLRSLLRHEEGSSASRFLQWSLALVILSFSWLIQIFFIRPEHKALIPSVKCCYGFSPKLWSVGKIWPFNYYGQN